MHIQKRAQITGMPLRTCMHRPMNTQVHTHRYCHVPARTHGHKQANTCTYTVTHTHAHLHTQPCTHQHTHDMLRHICVCSATCTYNHITAQKHVLPAYTSAYSNLHLNMYTVHICGCSCTHVYTLCFGRVSQLPGHKATQLTLRSRPGGISSCPNTPNHPDPK